MNALDAAIYTKLTGDTGAGGVNALATGGIHQLIATGTLGFPRVHYQELLNTGIYSFNTLSADHCYYQFTAFAVDGQVGGAVLAGTIAERIRTLLTDPSMAVTGKTLIYCRFERSIPARAELDLDGSRHIYSKGGIYEVWLAN